MPRKAALCMISDVRLGFRFTFVTLMSANEPWPAKPEIFACGLTKQRLHTKHARLVWTGPAQTAVYAHVLKQRRVGLFVHCNK